MDISTKGMGICKNPVDGQVVFVADTYPGELVEIEVTGKKKKITYGSKVKTLKDHDGKCEQFCKHFGVCGGCQLQVVDYQTQLQLKEKKVMDAFTRLAGLEISYDVSEENNVMKAIEACDDIYHYRNKVEFSIDSNTGIVGKHKQGSSVALTKIDDCKLQSRGSHVIYENVCRYLSDDALLLKEIQYIVIRWSHADENALVNIVTKRNLAHKLKRLAESLRKSHSEKLAGVVNSICDGSRPLEERRIVDEVLVWGKPELMEKLGSCVYRVSPNSFFQVNTKQTEKLYKYISEVAVIQRRNVDSGGLETSGTPTSILDLYCGTGTISIFLAQGASHVYGVDLSESCIKDARYNAMLNHVENVEFIHGDVGNVISSVPGPPPDVVIVDPARRGLSSSALQGLLKINPRLIVYVSCHVATQARDIAEIEKSGNYRVVSIKPFDLFPQTIHVETVVVCKRKDTI